MKKVTNYSIESDATYHFLVFRDLLSEKFEGFLVYTKKGSDLEGIEIEKVKKYIDSKNDGTIELIPM